MSENNAKKATNAADEYTQAVNRMVYLRSVAAMKVDKGEYTAARDYLEMWLAEAEHVKATKLPYALDDETEEMAEWNMPTEEETDAEKALQILIAGKKESTKKAAERHAEYEKLRELYPVREISSVQETDFVSTEKLQDALKEADSAVTVIGEVATDPVAARMIQEQNIYSAENGMYLADNRTMGTISSRSGRKKNA